MHIVHKEKLEQIIYLNWIPLPTDPTRPARCTIGYKQQ